MRVFSSSETRLPYGATSTARVCIRCALKQATNHAASSADQHWENRSACARTARRLTSPPNKDRHPLFFFMRCVHLHQQDTHFVGQLGGRRRSPRNVLGEPLDICSIKPMTGFYRDGCCNTGREDVGSHTICVVMTSAFLEFSKSRGNDLSTPVPAFGFPGLNPGDRWCLCAPRWQEAFEAGHAPRVVLRASHEGALAYCSLADLKRFAIDLA
jgi:uncharacterized protein